MILRYRFNDTGAHVHVRLFAGEDEQKMTLIGSLAFREKEWHGFLFTLGISAAALDQMKGREKEFETMAIVAGYPSGIVQSVLESPVEIQVVRSNE